jgi:hypothetical protein
MKIRMDGFNMSSKAAAGTVQTLLATAFTPALAQASALANTINDVADAGARALGHSPMTANLISGAGAAAVLGAMGYGAYNLAKGSISAGRLLRGLGGTAGGIAAGKAVQAATGTTPVFVTTVPSRFGELQLTIGLDAKPARSRSPTKVKAAVASKATLYGAALCQPDFAASGYSVVAEPKPTLDKNAAVYMIVPDEHLFDAFKLLAVDAAARVAKGGPGFGMHRPPMGAAPAARNTTRRPLT